MSDRFTQVDALQESHLHELWALYQPQWWSGGRNVDDIRLMLEHTSLVVALLDEEHRLAAFCRLLTDFTFRATLYDVMVADRYRGSGVGRILLDAVATHPRLQRVAKIWLNCRPDLIPLYEKWGFRTEIGDSRWMLKVQGDG